MPKDIGGLSGPLLIIQQAQPVCGREYQVGTTSLRPWQVLHGDNKKETLLMTYKAVGRSIINYAAPVWSPKPT